MTVGAQISSQGDDFQVQIDSETSFNTSTWNSLCTLKRRWDNFLVKKLLLQGRRFAPASWCQLGSSEDANGTTAWLKFGNPLLPVACSRLIVRAVVLEAGNKHKPPQAEEGTESLSPRQWKNTWAVRHHGSSGAELFAPLVQAVLLLHDLVSHSLSQHGSTGHVHLEEERQFPVTA